jgi:hypothetical protein
MAVAPWLAPSGASPHGDLGQRRASDSRPRERGLVSTPSMPAIRQDRRSARVADAVVATTTGWRVDGSRERIRRVTSVPSMTGRWTSISTTS